MADNDNGTEKTNGEAKQNADSIKDFEATQSGARGPMNSEPAEPVEGDAPPPMPH